MINYILIFKSNHWLPRSKKIHSLVNRILKFKDDLCFNKNIDYYCNLILTNDRLIKKINFKYRKKNKPTDVLTFISNINTRKKKIKICDIFLSAEIIKKDATRNNINFYSHLAHLFVHSFLHVNGLTHKEIKNFNKMKKLEIKILKKLQIQNPYL